IGVRFARIQIHSIGPVRQVLAHGKDSDGVWKSPAHFAVMTSAPGHAVRSAQRATDAVHQKRVAAHKASLCVGLVELLTEKRVVSGSVVLHQWLEDPRGSGPEVEHTVRSYDALLVTKTVRKVLRPRI